MASWFSNTARPCSRPAIAAPGVFRSKSSSCCTGPAFWTALAVVILACLTAGSARAVPSFAEQTGQPCAACHVGAFGPQLKPYGREFKLYGYVASDGRSHGLPLAATVQTSFTHTAADQDAAASRWFARNDNPAVDQVSLYYAGRITPTVGGFIQVTYDGVSRQLSLDNTDIRHTQEGTVFNTDVTFGITLNNNPTVQDLWNSTPVWSFPYNSSKLAPTPFAAALIEGSLAQRVAGLGVYSLWGELVYAEFDLYQGLGPALRNATGIVPTAGSDMISGLIPYWRLALQQEFGQHYVEVGTYGLNASIYPGGDRTAGKPNNLTDIAFDANWQWTQNPKSVVSDMLSAHASFIQEYASLGASSVIVGSNRSSNFNAFRADVSYSFAATVTPTIQYFQTKGARDSGYWGTPNGRPDSAGVTAEIAYVPFGKPDSSLKWLNLRLAAQYAMYTQFDGETRHASGHNALYVSLWGAIHF